MHSEPESDRACYVVMCVLLIIGCVVIGAGSHWVVSWLTSP